MSLNLAKRPFVDTRPVNALTAALIVAVLVLSAVSWRTFRAYLEGSRGTQAAIASLRSDIARYENARKAGEAALARFDVEQLGASAQDANQIARRRSFSWTRFLTRLEETLPPQVRVVGIALSRAAEGDDTRGKANGGMPLELTLISRDPLGLPDTIRRFYASPWFDDPTPHQDQSPERGAPEGRRISIGVIYHDSGRRTAAAAAAPAPAKAGSAPRSAAGRGGAR